MSKKGRLANKDAGAASPGQHGYQRYHLQRFAEIGMALSGEEDISRLMEMIVHEAREITHADAGTLYMLNEQRTHLNFVIMQNETMDVFLGGVEGGWISMPPVPLFADGPEGQRVENHAHVSAHVAHSSEIVNIPDVYESKAFDFSGTRTYDKQTGYRSRSMLVIPMRNHEKDVIGVLQLLNARDPESGRVVVFDDEHVPLVASLASQAAVTLTRTRLIEGLTELLDAFIRSIAQAIEEKSRYTGGHISRVSRLATMIAEQINEEQDGPFKQTHFSAHELEELRLAAWLHDIGKIITPEFIVDKSRRLETICDRGKHVATRFELIEAELSARHSRRMLELQQAQAPAEQQDAEQREFERQVAELQEERAFVLECNLPDRRLHEQDLRRLQEIAAKVYEYKGERRPYLEEDELKNLAIPVGTLTSEERKIMEDHADLTWRMLSTLPFPKHLGRVPEYAAQHHEKLDGSGYPFGMKGAELSLQARIMAVADIFEALTARDRPYKKPMNLSQAVKVLGQLKNAEHIDGDVHDLLVTSGVLSAYARDELDPDQVDIPLELAVKQPGNNLQQRHLEWLQRRPPADVQRSRPLLLLVDGSQSNRMLVSYYLKHSQFDLDFAESGLDGLSLLAQKGHDMVLADLELSPMDGCELARRIRQWEAQHGLPARPVMVMAAPFFTRSNERLQGSGCTDCLTRPFGKPELLAFLERYAV